MAAVRLPAPLGLAGMLFFFRDATRGISSFHSLKKREKGTSVIYCRGANERVCEVQSTFFTVPVFSVQKPSFHCFGVR